MLSIEVSFILDYSCFTLNYSSFPTSSSTLEVSGEAFQLRTISLQQTADITPVVSVLGQRYARQLFHNY